MGNTKANPLLFELIGTHMNSEKEGNLMQKLIFHLPCFSFRLKLPLLPGGCPGPRTEGRPPGERFSWIQSFGSGVHGFMQIPDVNIQGFSNFMSSWGCMLARCSPLRNLEPQKGVIYFAFGDV